MQWTRSVNAGGWLATWESEDGQFRIEKHVGPTAKYDYGHLSGQPYRVWMLVELDEPVDGDTHAWQSMSNFHLLKQAKFYCERHLVRLPNGNTPAQEDFYEMMRERNESS